MNQSLHPINTPLSPWWHDLTLEMGQVWHCAIGTLSLYLERGTDRWLLATEQLADLPENYRVLNEPLDAMPERLKPTRYVFESAPTKVALRPRLLDRPVVMKTEQPVIIPSGERITFYISSPVCVSIELQDPHVVLQEVPALRLSDTWFGPSTRVGEFCYAARTHARINREEVPLRPHRAVTPILIHNRSEEPLTIDKLSIPVPFLAVYGLADGTLWTDSVSLEHTQGSHLANLTIDRKLPAGVTEQDRLTVAREPVPKGSLIRAFTNMFIG